jgi:hypothetical protein
MKHRIGVGVALLCFAGCGGGGGDLGRLHVALNVINSPDRPGFVRGKQRCGPPMDKVPITVPASDGTVTVRDRHHTVVGHGLLTPSTGTPLARGATLTCNIQFDVDVKGKPSVLIFDVAWKFSSTTLTLRAETDDVQHPVSGNVLVLTKQL